MLARILLVVSLFVAARLPAADPPITAAVFTPDGISVAVGSQSGLCVYAWPELAIQRTLDSKLVQVHDLAFSPDRRTLAAVGGQPGQEGRIELFSWPQTALLDHQTLGDDVLYRVAWRPGGQVPAVAGPDRRITLLDRAANFVGQIEGHSQAVVTIEFLPDGHLVSGSRDSTLRIWKTTELIRTLNNHTNEVHDVALRPGATNPPFVIASSSADRTVRFWWPVRGRLMRFAKLPSSALDIEWTSDGTRLIAACADGHVRTIDPDSVKILSDIEVGTGWLHTLAVAPDGASAFVGGSSGLMKAVKIR